MKANRKLEPVDWVEKGEKDGLVNPTFHVRLVGELFSPRNAA